jgi:vanillate/4-hydroxybenzoate decarboxylase subunit D
MSTPTATTMSVQGLVCPRCRCAEIGVRTTSPVPGVWTVYGCGRCLYTWRSTEPERNTDPEKYPAVFRLTAEALGNLPVVPTIPARRAPLTR